MTVGKSRNQGTRSVNSEECLKFHGSSSAKYKGKSEVAVSVHEGERCRLLVYIDESYKTAISSQNKL